MSYSVQVGSACCSLGRGREPVSLHHVTRILKQKTGYLTCKQTRCRHLWQVSSATSITWLFRNSCWEVLRVFLYLHYLLPTSKTWKEFFILFSAQEKIRRLQKLKIGEEEKRITYNASLIAIVIGQTYSLDKYCYRNSYVEYPAYLKRLNSISNSTTLKFENLCWILQLKLYLQGTTMRYRISKRI